jgi:hypothetical protein
MNNSDIKFCAGCHAYVLNFKLFNQPIPKTDIEGFRFEPNFPFNLERPVCTLGEFFFGDSCSDCPEGCNICSDANTCLPELCFDPLCSSCDDTSEGSTCNVCGDDGTLLNGICECVDGFFRGNADEEC